MSWMRFQRWVCGGVTPHWSSRPGGHFKRAISLTFGHAAAVYLRALPPFHLAVTGDPTTGEHADTGRRFYLLFEGLRAGRPAGQEVAEVVVGAFGDQLAAVERRDRD